MGPSRRGRDSARHLHQQLAAAPVDQRQADPLQLHRTGIGLAEGEIELLVDHGEVGHGADAPVDRVAAAIVGHREAVRVGLHLDARDVARLRLRDGVQHEGLHQLRSLFGHGHRGGMHRGA
ncbi:hypothetical protein ABXN37_07510 [Piscinibacter sakaiensis]|uniref:hypothetical protein n=1 Tax=Piscinibacter sakaiensis TaxID=1547922 RepID=UPI00372B986B